MTRFARAPMFAFASALAALATSVVGAPSSDAAEPTAADAGMPSSLPACIGVKTDARWVPYGYNHVVILTSGCEHAASCDVSTDVNPVHQLATVAPRQTVEVTTFTGSPSSVFIAKVACSLR